MRLAVGKARCVNGSRYSIYLHVMSVPHVRPANIPKKIHLCISSPSFFFSFLLLFDSLRCTTAFPLQLFSTALVPRSIPTCSMVLFYLLWRFTTVSESVDPSHAARDEAIGQSPLHILPAPVLILLAFGCLILAACVAGLTLGLMSLDPLGLDIVMHSSDAAAAEAARKVKPVREKGNLLLVTLLFANTLATELLPLVLEALVPGGYFSLVVSVISIMLFGEIIPQAICSRHPLIIGSYMIGFVKALRILMYPVSFPIAYILDKFLGVELGTIYNREELKGLIEVHRTNQVLTQDETSILKGALDFSQKTVEDICTPADKVFKLNIDSKLDKEAMLKLLRSGHSRIPLYENHPNNIVCLLLVKQLILVDSSEEHRIRTLMSKQFGSHKIRVAPALECGASILISDLLNEFQKGRSHMAIVYDDISKPVEEREFIGIASIEDIIEEILQVRFGAATLSQPILFPVLSDVAFSLTF